RFRPSGTVCWLFIPTNSHWYVRKFSGRELTQQRLRLLQIARVEPLREPAVHWSQEFAASLTLPWSRAGATCIASPGRPLHLVGADQVTLRRWLRRWRSRRVSRACAVSISRSNLKDARVTRWISAPTP